MPLFLSALLLVFLNNIIIQHFLLFFMYLAFDQTLCNELELTICVKNHCLLKKKSKSCKKYKICLFIVFGHIGKVKLIISGGRPHKTGYQTCVSVKPPVHHRLTGKPPCMKVFTPIRIQTHAVSDFSRSTAGDPLRIYKNVHGVC